MGYSTAFTGVINLSRQLTIPEAKELLDIWEGGLDSGIITVADNVVTAKKQAIDHGGPHTPLTIEKLQQIALDRMLER